MRVPDVDILQDRVEKRSTITSICVEDEDKIAREVDEEPIVLIHFMNIYLKVQDFAGIGVGTIVFDEKPDESEGELDSIRRVYVPASKKIDFAKT